MTDPKVIRTRLDEGTSFVSTPGRSSGRREIESFTNDLVRSLREAPKPRETPTVRTPSQLPNG